MFHNLLVAIDGSPHGERALSEAIEYAEGGNAHLTIMTCVPDPSAWLLTGGPYGGGVDFKALAEDTEQATGTCSRRPCTTSQRTSP